MKKMLILSLALLLILFCAPAHADTFSVEGLMKITFPDGWIVVDKADDEENNETFQNIAFLYEDKVDGLCMDVYTNFYKDWEDFTLSKCTDAEFDNYIDVIIDDYEEHDPMYLYSIDGKANGIPYVFVVFDMTDELGPYYFAETMASGWALTMSVYAFTDENYDTCRPLTDADTEVFLDILRTFEPLP